MILPAVSAHCNPPPYSLPQHNDAHGSPSGEHTAACSSRHHSHFPPSLPRTHWTLVVLHWQYGMFAEDPMGWAPVVWAVTSGVVGMPQGCAALLSHTTTMCPELPTAELTQCVKVTRLE
jgi:hypothetical protein